MIPRWCMNEIWRYFWYPPTSSNHIFFFKTYLLIGPPCHIIPQVHHLNSPMFFIHLWIKDFKPLRQIQHHIWDHCINLNIASKTIMSTWTVHLKPYKPPSSSSSSFKFLFLSLFCFFFIENFPPPSLISSFIYIFLPPSSPFKKNSLLLLHPFFFSFVFFFHPYFYFPIF